MKMDKCKFCANTKIYRYGYCEDCYNNNFLNHYLWATRKIIHKKTEQTMYFKDEYDMNYWFKQNKKHTKKENYYIFTKEEGSNKFIPLVIIKNPIKLWAE